MEEKGFTYIENFVCIDLNPHLVELKDNKKQKITEFFTKKQGSTEGSQDD